MPVITKYKAIRTPEGLKILDVIMASIGDPNGKELNKKMLAGFITNFKKRTDKGAVGAYILLNHGGARVGRIMSLSEDGKNLIGDLLVTDEVVAKQIENSDLSDVSITFFPRDNVLVDVSILDKDFGALSDSIPPLLIDIVKEFGYKETELVTYNYQEPRPTADKLNSGNKGKTTMALSPEDIQVIKDLISAAMGSGDPAPSEDPVNEEKLNKALADVAKQKLSITIDGYVRNLESKGYSNTDHLRKTFGKFGDNTVAMGVEYQRLMEKANEDIKLEMEVTYEAPKMEDTLRKEWEAYKVTYKSEIDFVTFAQLAKDEGRADLSNKAMNVISGSVKL